VVIRTQISMTEAQAEALRRLSAARGTSQAALLREALDLLLTEDERAQRVRRALAVVGRYRSGSGDTSARHDDALAEIYLQ
jgi:hypothetical protein